MSGLIDGAKSKVWSICNQILNGRPMPTLKVGLVAFRDKGDEYVTKVYDLRDDLDEVYADIQTFRRDRAAGTPPRRSTRPSTTPSTRSAGRATAPRSGSSSSSATRRRTWTTSMT